MGEKKQMILTKKITNTNVDLPHQEVELISLTSSSITTHAPSVTHIQRTTEYGNGKPSNFTVEKPSKCCLNQMVTVNTTKTCHMVTRTP